MTQDEIFRQTQGNAWYARNRGALHWVDRSTLARSVAEIDRITRDGGFLLFGDFLPDHAQRRRYLHYTATEMYTYKQDYAWIFEALGTYRQVARITFDHDHLRGGISIASSAVHGVCSLPRKTTNPIRR
jgi:hypothetical protein